VLKEGPGIASSLGFGRLLPVAYGKRGLGGGIGLRGTENEENDRSVTCIGEAGCQYLFSQ